MTWRGRSASNSRTLMTSGGARSTPFSSGTVRRVDGPEYHWSIDSRSCDYPQRPDPRALPQTLRELAEAQDTSAGDAAAEEARRGIATCDAKLRQHRAALEAGADPKIVTGWIAEVQAQRAAAEARLRHSPSHQHVSPDDISRAVTSLGDLVAVLASADPVKKAATYAQLGLTLTYRPGERTVTAEARPLGHMYVTTWCAISFGVSSPGWWGDRLVAACYQAAARSDTSEPMARTVSGRSSRRPIQRCSGRQ